MNQRTRHRLFFLLTVAIVCLAISAYAEDHHNRMQVIPETGHDTSQPLRDLESSVSSAVVVPRRVMPLLRPVPIPQQLPRR